MGGTISSELTVDERATMLELLAYPNAEGLHPDTARWRDFARTELSLRDERINQLERQSVVLAAEIDKQRAEYSAEVNEFNAGYEAAQQRLPESSEPSDTKHDVWKCGYAWAMFDKLKAEIDRMRPVVESAQRWGHGGNMYLPELAKALLAYEAAKEQG